MAIPTEMSKLASRSEPSLSVTHGNVNAGLLNQQENVTNNASLDRAHELVAQMPSSVRETLPAPIEEQPNDSQSVVNLIDDKSENSIGISGEESDTLASIGMSYETDYEPRNSNYDYFSKVPRRLWYALLRILETNETYSSIDNESSSGYSSHGDQMLSRGDSATSRESMSSTMPILPESRPPARPPSNSEYNNSDDVESWYEPTEKYTRARNLLLPACRFRLLIIISASLAIAALAAGIYFLIKIPDSNRHPTISTFCSVPSSNETYDCVQGSITPLVVDGEFYQLADLKLPEQCPTLTVGSFEYLLVRKPSIWSYAQKYCTGWCGYLVSIKGSEESAVIRELTEANLREYSGFWTGLKAWNAEWYLDDESSVTYFNFGDPVNRNIINSNSEDLCVQSNNSGFWSIQSCQAMLPFVCERNTADPNIHQTPFAPYQEKPCQNAGGICKMDNDCGTDSHQILHFCPEQPKNILCCIPNTPNPTPPPPLNSTVKTCTDAGGICNHVEADQCRGGRVVFDLPTPCPDGPRPYGCCIENEHLAG